MNATEQIKMQEENKRLREALKTSQWAMQQPIDDWKGECEAKALKACTEALAATEQPEAQARMAWDAERYQAIRSAYEKHHAIVVDRKRKFSLINPFTNYEYDTFKTLDEAVDASISAQKGPQ